MPRTPPRNAARAGHWSGRKQHKGLLACDDSGLGRVSTPNSHAHSLLVLKWSHTFNLQPLFDEMSPRTQRG